MNYTEDQEISYSEYEKINKFYSYKEIKNAVNNIMNLFLNIKTEEDLQCIVNILNITDFYYDYDKTSEIFRSIYLKNYKCLKTIYIEFVVKYDKFGTRYIYLEKLKADINIVKKAFPYTIRNVDLENITHEEYQKWISKYESQHTIKKINYYSDFDFYNNWYKKTNYTINYTTSTTNNSYR